MREMRLGDIMHVGLDWQDRYHNYRYMYHWNLYLPPDDHRKWNVCAFRNPVVWHSYLDGLTQEFGLS